MAKKNKIKKEQPKEKIIPNEINLFRQFLLRFNFGSYLAEGIGAFIFVLFACGSVLLFRLYGDLDKSTVGAIGAAGLVVSMFATLATGAHINPVVTVGMWLVGKCKTLDAVFYIIFQILGSLLSGWLLLMLFGERGVNFSLGGPVLGIGVSLQTAIIFEAILSTILVFVYFSVMQTKIRNTFGPVVVGLFYFVAYLFSEPISGGAINPLKVSVLFFAGDTDSAIVWLAGPLVGALCGFIYMFVTHLTKSVYKIPSK